MSGVSGTPASSWRLKAGPFSRRPGSPVVFGAHPRSGNPERASRRGQGLGRRRTENKPVGGRGRVHGLSTQRPVPSKAYLRRGCRHAVVPRDVAIKIRASAAHVPPRAYPSWMKRLPVLVRGKPRVFSPASFLAVANRVTSPTSRAIPTVRMRPACGSRADADRPFGPVWSKSGSESRSLRPATAHSGWTARRARPLLRADLSCPTPR